MGPRIGKKTKQLKVEKKGTNRIHNQIMDISKANNNNNKSNVFVSLPRKW